MGWKICKFFSHSRNVVVGVSGSYYDDNMVRLERAPCSFFMGRVLIAAFIIWILIFIYLSFGLFAVQLRGKLAESSENTYSNFQLVLLRRSQRFWRSNC